MEELVDYDFPFCVTLIGTDDFNDKFLILLLTQNGYKVKHLILDAKKENVINLNAYYTKYELTQEQSKSLNSFIEESQVVLINDLDTFERFSDLQAIKAMNKTDKQFPLIINQKFEIFIPNLNSFYTIFDDKQMLSFSGILSSTRPYREYSPPYIPKVNLFEIFLKGIFIGTFINFSLYNKLHNNNCLEIINKPFLNLIYLYFNFFKCFIKNMAEDLDKGESIFPREHYNYAKTKDGKFVSFGNIEPKFQENMKKLVGKINIADNKEKSGMMMEEEALTHRKINYDLDFVSKVFANHNREELFVKFYNTETCVTPVLSLEDAINFQKNLNKSIFLNDRMKNTKKLESLKQIEEFFFSDLKNAIVIDLNPKVYVQYPISNKEKDANVNINVNSNVNSNVKDISISPKF